jgi:hypothetical protein
MRRQAVRAARGRAEIHRHCTVGIATGAWLQWTITTGIMCVTPSPESTTVPVRMFFCCFFEANDAANASTACNT